MRGSTAGRRSSHGAERQTRCHREHAPFTPRPSCPSQGPAVGPPGTHAAGPSCITRRSTHSSDCLKCGQGDGSTTTVIPLVPLRTLSFREGKEPVSGHTA